MYHKLSIRVIANVANIAKTLGSAPTNIRTNLGVCNPREGIH